MKSSYLRTFIILCGCSFGALLAVMAAGVAQERSPRASLRQAGGTPAPQSVADAAITVPGCRIKLIQDVQLASERPGILAYVAREGESVRLGDVVAQIRDDVVRANFTVAEKQATNDVEVRFARKATELAQLKYLRAIEANKQSLGTVPELELRELRLMAEKSLLQLEQAEQQFLLAGLKRDETREQLRTYRVETPFDAVVLHVYKQAGEVVREGDPILEVANTAWVRVEGYLPIEEAHRVHKGSPVTVVVQQASRASEAAASRGSIVQASHVANAAGTAAPQREASFPGQVGFVGTKVEPVTRKIRIWAVVENRGGLLRDGLVATMRIGE